MPTLPQNPPSASTTTEGIAAMVPIANITLEDALLDNPNFRTNIKLFEGQVFFIESWLIALFTEEWKRLNEVTSLVNKRAEVPLLSQGMLSSHYTIPAMKLTSSAFHTTLALKSKYTSEINDKVLKPLEDFLKTDLKEFKESKKMFDKALEKYESTLAKYNGQSRQKEPSAIREEAFQLYDTRKAYIQAAMACSMLCIKFQDALDQMILGVFLDLIATQHDYFSGNADHFGGMALQVLQLKTYMKCHKDASAITLQELEQNKDKYTADAVEYWKPSRSLKSYSNNIQLPMPKSTIGHAALGPAFATQIAGQVPINAFMTRPATISQFSTAGINRLPIPIQHLQPHPTMPNISTSVVTSGIHKPNSLQSSPLEGNASTPGRSNNSSPLILPNSMSQLPLPNPTSPQMTECDIVPTTKQGYLNIRIPQPKNRAPVWQRKYFFIQEAEFGFESVVSNPTVGAQVVQSERIAVLLCEVRYGSSSNSLPMSGGGNPASGSQGLAMVQMERRFCFEVVCSTQSYLLQAETEDDLMSWVNTFEAAKRDMLMQQTFPRHPESDEPYSPIPDSANPSFSFSGEDLLAAETARLKLNEETEESKSAGALGLGWAANVPGVSLLLGSYAGINNPTNKPGPATDPSVPASNVAGENYGQSNPVDQPDNNTGTAPPTPESRTGLGIDIGPVSLPRPSSIDTEAAVHPRSRSVGEVSAGSEQRSSHSQQLSEIEKLMTSSLHLVPKATHLAVSEIPHYPMELIVRNRELHLRFHGTKVHSKEYVLHSWTSGYLDDSRPENPIIVYGRIFLTQSGMYFYARDLSVETKRMFRFSSIRGIECEQKDISTEWRIETMDGSQHIFSQFTLTDTEYRVLHLIWTNVHQTRTKDRLPVKELFRRTVLITNRPKGSAGSGSLAETESNHLTTRDGTMTHAPGYDEDYGSKNADGLRSETASVRADDDDWNELEEDFPADMEAPSGPVSCNCPGHLEKLDLERTFDISAKTMNQLLFGDNSPLWKEFHERRNNKVQSEGEWEKTGDHKTRIVKFLMVVNNPLVKLNQTDCIENQTCEVEEEHVRYSYTTKSSVLAMPYSDAFTPILRYCITYVSKNQCKLTCSSGIEWHKNPMVKAMIKGAVFKGTAETVKDITEIIQFHLERYKNQKRRADTLRSGASASGVTSAGEAGASNHARKDSAKIMISLHGPDDDGHSILLDPRDDHSNGEFAADTSKDSRVPGARRHTVSTAAGSGGLMYSGPRVQGYWPTGAPPTFKPIGSKASRTKLLGRPSRSALVSQDISPESQVGKVESTGPVQDGVRWLKENLLNLVHSEDEKERRSMSTKLLCLVLLVSSLINIWAAYNSQRMLNSAWRLKDRRSSLNSGNRGSGVIFRGYPEPLYRVFDGGSSHSQHNQGDLRNVRVAARAVFLRDLEEQMRSGELEGFSDDGKTVDQKCFEIFLEVRDTFRAWPQSPLEWYPDQNNDRRPDSYSGTLASTSTSLAPGQPTSSPDSRFYDKPTGTMTKYPWLLPHHRRWATKIIFQRDRVGILRHDLLATFEVLKELERRLLETEYINWIMDERSRCRLWEHRKMVSTQLKKQKKLIMTNKQLTDDHDNQHENLSPTASTLDAERETPVLNGEFLRQLEIERDLHTEKAKQQITEDKPGHEKIKKIDTDDDQDESDDDEGEEVKKRLFKTKVAKEFCEGLEHQIELFLLESTK
ncbi:SNF1-interacting protein [Dissophora ornata]|nr:SNF1-interacting protein [Dissophora ornata]